MTTRTYRLGLFEGFPAFAEIDSSDDWGWSVAPEVIRIRTDNGIIYDRHPFNDAGLVQVYRWLQDGTLVLNDDSRLCVNPLGCYYGKHSSVVGNGYCPEYRFFYVDGDSNLIHPSTLQRLWRLTSIDYRLWYGVGMLKPLESR
jgi:hypothetical protein